MGEDLPELDFDVGSPWEGEAQNRGRSDDGSGGPGRAEVPEPEETGGDGEETTENKLPPFREIVSGAQKKKGEKLAVNELTALAKVYGRMREVSDRLDEVRDGLALSGLWPPSESDDPAARSRRRREERIERAENFGDLDFDVGDPYS